MRPARNDTEPRHVWGLAYMHDVPNTGSLVSLQKMTVSTPYTTTNRVAKLFGGWKKQRTFYFIFYILAAYDGCRAPRPRALIERCSSCARVISMTCPSLATVFISSEPPI